MPQKTKLFFSLAVFIAVIALAAALPGVFTDSNTTNPASRESIELIGDAVDQSTTTTAAALDMSSDLPPDVVESTTTSSTVPTPSSVVVEAPNQEDPVVPPTTAVDPPATVPPLPEAPVEDPPIFYDGPGIPNMCGSLPCCPKSTINANGEVIWFTPDGQPPRYACSNDTTPPDGVV